MPTDIVFAADACVRVTDEPHEVLTKLKQGAVQFQRAGEEAGAVHLLNPALILYLEKVGDGDGADPAAG